MTESSYQYTCSIMDGPDDPMVSLKSIVQVSPAKNKENDPEFSFKTTVNRKVVDFEQFKKKEADLSKIFNQLLVDECILMREELEKIHNGARVIMDNTAPLPGQIVTVQESVPDNQLNQDNKGDKKLEEEVKQEA